MSTDAAQNIPASLRVVHLNSMLTGGGTDDQCVKLAAGLHALGLRVWVAGPEGREFSRRIREAGVAFHATPDNKPGFILSAARLIRRERIQIVHGHHGRDLWRTGFAARLSGVRPKVVLSRHMAKSPSSWFTRRFLLSQCDAMIAVSEFTATVLRKGHYDPDSPVEERHSRPPLLGDLSKIHVIFGGIDTTRFRPISREDPAVQAQRRQWGLEPDHFAFGVAGGFDLPRGKGQREFLQAAARVHEQIPRARFLIIGRGNMEALLREDIQRLGLTGKAIVAGQCADMAAGMNALDCLVHPQIATEALGLVVCEAHACGKPVIASDLDGIPEAFAIGGRGELVTPGDVAALGQALLRQERESPPSFDEKQRLHRLVEEQFSIPVCSRKVAALYGAIANSQ